MIWQLLPIYAAAAAVGAFMTALHLATEETRLSRQLGTEGRVVLGIAIGVLWPLVAVVAIGWLLRAAWRGLVQCVRLVVPARSKLPKARVRR